MFKHCLTNAEYEEKKMSNPIPTKHRAEFYEYMSKMARYHDVPNDWALLDYAEEFMQRKKLDRGSPLDALKQYEKHVINSRSGNINSQ